MENKLKIRKTVTAKIDGREVCRVLRDMVAQKVGMGLMTGATSEVVYRIIDESDGHDGSEIEFTVTLVQDFTAFGKAEPEGGAI